jgi:hypothetical protein
MSRFHFDFRGQTIFESGYLSMNAAAWQLPRKGSGAGHFSLEATLE